MQLVEEDFDGIEVLGEEVEERRGEPGRGGEDELAAEVERQ